jgi:hypothetical protein
MSLCASGSLLQPCNYKSQITLEPEEEEVFRARLPCSMPWRPGVLAATSHNAQVSRRSRFEAAVLPCTAQRRWWKCLRCLWCKRFRTCSLPSMRAAHYLHDLREAGAWCHACAKFRNCVHGQLPGACMSRCEGAPHLVIRRHFAELESAVRHLPTVHILLQCDSNMQPSVLLLFST